MSKGSLEISAYQPAITLASQSSDRPLDARWITVMAGALISAALHLLLLVAIGFGNGKQTKSHDTAPGPALQWVNVSIENSSEDSADSPPALSPQPKLVRIAITLPPGDFSTDFGDDTSQEVPAVSSTEQLGNSVLFGRYVGQISARIERAWLRPRSAIGAERFDCRVRIEQDRTGKVLEITLEQCNGDSRWQTSLVRAIESASPLPAPPTDPDHSEEHVFASTLRLSFQSAVYTPGVSADFYEPETRDQ